MEPKDVNITLLPDESMAGIRIVGIADGISSWKLFQPTNCSHLISFAVAHSLQTQPRLPSRLYHAR
jgi:hypothetical protein